MGDGRGPGPHPGALALPPVLLGLFVVLAPAVGSVAVVLLTVGGELGLLHLHLQVAEPEPDDEPEALRTDIEALRAALLDFLKSVPPPAAKAAALTSLGQQRDPADFAASNEVELFLAMGSERGLRPQDVVGVLSGRLEGLAGEAEAGQESEEFIGHGSGCFRGHSAKKLVDKLIATLPQNGHLKRLRCADSVIDLSRIPEEVGILGFRCHIGDAKLPKQIGLLLPRDHDIDSHQILLDRMPLLCKIV